LSATAKLLGWSVALGLTLSVTYVQANPPTVAGGTPISWLVLGQASPGGDGAEARRMAEDWLKQAREAMDKGNLELAEYYLQRAEKLGVTYDPLLARLKDTPAKVRQDLEALRATPGPAAPTTGSGSQPQRDGYGGGSPASGASGALGGPMVATGAFPVAESENAARGRELLLAARKSLAKGDAARAALLVEQAKKLGLTHALHEDSPDKIDSLIRGAATFAKGPAAGVDATGYTRDFAQFLLDQAVGLLGYQDIDGARQLAQQAKDLQARYGQFDRTPDQVLAQIATAQQAWESPSVARQNLTDSGTGPRRLPAEDGAPGPLADARRLIAQARAALDRGDVLAAKQYAEQAQNAVPESAYGPDDVRPWEILLEVNKAMNSRHMAAAPGGNYPTRQAVGTEQNAGGSYPVTQGLFDPTKDASRTVAAQGLEPTPATPPGGQPSASAGERLYRQGLQALENHDRETALQSFRDAWKYEQELDPVVRHQLRDKLMLLTAGATPATGGAGQEPSPLEAVDAQQQLLRQKLYREITSEQAEAQRLSATDPKAALTRLEKLRERVNASEVDPGSKKQLLTLVDRSVDSLQQYIAMNKTDIDLAEQNREVLDGVKLDAQRRQQVHEKLASLVEEFNNLLDEHRYPEAELLAKQARELDPGSPVVESMTWKARFVRRIHEQMAIKDKKEQGFYDGMTAVDEAAAGFDDRDPYRHGDAKIWQDISTGRSERLERQQQRLTKAELEIQKAMTNKVDVKFDQRPLSEVLDILSELSGVPIVLDPAGLAAEGVTSETPVDIRLRQQISLRSALDLILAPLRLSHVIESEVLRVTSEQTRNSHTYHRVYNVADLVIPIPNFVPGYNTGLAGAIQYAHNALGVGNHMSPMGHSPLAVAANDAWGGKTNASVLAQMGAGGLVPSLSSQQANSPMGFGPGGMGGAAMADFDTLIELIRSTIAPDTWDEMGGAGAIESYPVNLSLVISQTQEVHEQIADLLDQLRRLQDLQITIEVRFITLADNFAERIGIDFDFSIDDNVDVDMIRGSERTGGLGDDTGPSVMFGLNESGPTRTLDLEFTQGSFGGTAIPQFGPFDAQTAANFGFAILSDIEVFFLLQAFEGNTRSNVLQAPKVTLFNGQNASVQDLTQRPFVTSIIPVVGDFAAAQQPVIVVLSEGTQLNVQAVVSSDRRFVRLTLVPFFSRIGPVNTFQFEGDVTTDSGTAIIDPDGEQTGRENEIRAIRGTTVQLPTFIFTTVSTTVSVPDGGTVLLGGIKRLSEGRTERGVPMLSKLPYINRLFKNANIGRDTQSLMMMVTPRIIIQEEEELKQTGYDSSQ